jgi:hypothetical protein
MKVANLLHVTTLIALVLGASPATFAASTTVHDGLRDALLCKGEPADAVQVLLDAGSDFAQGYAVHGFGEDLSYKAVVILEEPLTIAGATSKAVIAGAESVNFEFSAFVSAQFTGDYKSVVEALKLEPTKDFNEMSMGRYVSEQVREGACPNTIILTPQADGQFLLGCGWCNGG